MNNTHTLSVLMIEDDADDRYLTESVFANGDYKVKIDFLDDPGNLIPYLIHSKDAERLPSLIILDKELPQIDGMELLRQLKQHVDFCHIPVVMISGYHSADTAAESYALGASSFIHKPDSGRLTRERMAAFMNYWFGIVDLPNRQMNLQLQNMPQLSFADNQS